MSEETKKKLRFFRNETQHIAFNVKETIKEIRIFKDKEMQQYYKFKAQAEFNFQVIFLSFFGFLNNVFFCVA